MLAFILGVVLAIDPAHSSAQFSVEHVFVEHVTGTVPIVRGSIELPPGSTVPTNVSAQLDATHLHTDDSDRDAALTGGDWFDTKSYPTWTFQSTNIAPAPGGFTMTGMLTIHGVAQSETLAVMSLGTAERPHYRATCKIDRHAFGMKIVKLDPVIGNPVDVTLDITTAIR
ncbi:MAG: YceI family protein [Candidatus Eremiobacteraeota bacterium]|nr:YceI family protein [Candidatus Eremiobacteraeota bacterium]